MLGGMRRGRVAHQCCARLRAAVTGLRISCATRAASSPIAASFSACASERSTATRALQQLGGVEQQRELAGERLRRFDLLVVNDARSTPVVMNPQPQRRRGLTIGVTPTTSASISASCSWCGSSRKMPPAKHRASAACRLPPPARPDALQRPQVERRRQRSPSPSSLEQHAGAAQLQDADELLHAAPAALDDAELGRQPQQRSLQLELPALPAAEHQIPDDTRTAACIGTSTSTGARPPRTSSTGRAPSRARRQQDHRAQ